MLARGIAEGARSPRQALTEIVGQAAFARPPGNKPWEEASIWPVYGPFHSVAVRWSDAEERGELSPELLAALELETREAARQLVGDRGSS
jgi:hypothetical protein